jgi:alkaline phosphatase D
VANYRADEAAQTVLGAKQKAWFLERLRGAKATWKIWGNSLGTPDWRVDPQHLPAALAKWPGAGFAVMGTSDWGGTYHERAEIFDAVRDAGITGFAIVSGDRHSFWAGYAAKALPPAAFEPVNLLLHHGVRSALEYASSGDLQKAHASSNPDMAPHLCFVDMGGHGYATVRVDADAMQTEFVCIPRPIERSPREDGGPLRYRVRHEVPLWRAGERPRMRQTIVEGDPGLAV